MAISHSLLPTAALQEGQHPRALIAYLDSLSVDACHLDRETTHRVREAVHVVNVFTVNDRKDAEVLFAWGVNAVFTDFPEVIDRIKSDKSHF